jgi:predicted transcriptional regulator
VPSKSKAQHNLMAMVAHDPKAAKRLGISQSVGQDYVQADKGRKFAFGGSMKESKEMMKKEVAFMKKKGAPKSMVKHEESEMADKAGRAMKNRTPDKMGRAMVKMASGGSVGSASKRADGIATKGKTKGKMIAMNKGGYC